MTNGTDGPVTFNRISDNCVPDAPESFTVAAHDSWSVTVTQKHSDDGLDNCYLSHHSLVYEDAANAGNTFGVQQYDNSGDPACLGIKIFVIFRVGQAICPVTQGSLSGPKSVMYFNPGSQTPQISTTCPGGIAQCRSQGGRTQMFGFYISNPEPFTVTAANGNTAAGMDCVLSDQAWPQDNNSCVTDAVGVQSGGQAVLSLAGSCGKFYRLADRTNVQLLCTIPVHRLESGALSGQTAEWPNVANGSSFTMTGN